MNLIVGLGNPGNQYNFTRHNSGFLALDFYVKTQSLTWETHTKFDSVWLKSDRIILVKPQTFYNDSGVAVSAFAHFFKINFQNILIICDDFNLSFGELRYRESGSAGGNNGLKSIIEQLGTSDFPRLRLGTSNPELRQKIGDTDFVLGKFTTEEKVLLPDILQNISTKISTFNH